MSERKRKKSAPSKNERRSAAAGHRRAMTIGVSGRAPEVSRTELRRWVRTVLQHLNQTQAELSLALVTDPEIHDLNRRYRGRARPPADRHFPPPEASEHSPWGGGWC